MTHAAATMDDHALVARVATSQDTAAFGELIRRHQSQVRIFLRRLTRDESHADDLAQDCFLHAWNRIHTYTGRGSFIGWVLKIAYTTFLQSKRRSKRYDEILDQASHEASRLPGSPGGIEESLDVDRLLGVLSEEDRAILIMSYACGLSHREIGAATGLPTGTVKSIIHRGKDRIREHFDIEDHQHG